MGVLVIVGVFDTVGVNVAVGVHCAVPGLNIHMHLKPTAIGEYEIACAELCGLGHYKMHGMVHVVSQEDFDKWLAAREAEKQ